MIRFSRNLISKSIALAAVLSLPCMSVSAHPAQKSGHPEYLGYDTSKFLPESAVRYGQLGYALTVFHGTKIERFRIELLGVLTKVNNGKDLILFRALDGPSVTRQAMIVAGMSGSPVYVHGKMVGAIAYGLPFAREPIGLITPIRDMLESWDPHLPNTPSLSAAQSTKGLSEQSVSVSGSEIAPMLAGQNLGGALPSGPMSFEPMMTPIAVSGMSPEGIAQLAQQLAPYRLMPVAGGGSGAEHLSHAAAIKAAAGMQPGAAVGVSLAQGDLDLTAIGTLTYRDGNRIVAFGHPFTGIGPIDAALTTASITDIFPSYEESTKLGVPLDTVGRIAQDRPFSVGGTIGAEPTMIPVDVSINDESDDHHSEFHARVINHPLLTGVLALTVVTEAISEAHGTPGDAVAYVTTDVDADQVGHIVRTNVFYDPLAINTSAVGDLNDIVSLLSSNPFYQVALKSVSVKIRIVNLHATADIDHIVVPRLTYAPGDTVSVGVVLKPYKQDAVVKTVSMTIPANTPDGQVALLVRGGATSDMPSISIDPNGGISVHTGSDSDSGEPPASTVQQLVGQLLRQPKNNELVTTLILPNAAPEVGGEKLSLLPPTMAQFMRAEHISTLHVAHDEIKSETEMPWVVSGAQQIMLTVHDKVDYDTSTADTGPQVNGSQLPPPPPGQSVTTSGPSDGSQVGSMDGDDPGDDSDSSSSLVDPPVFSAGTKIAQPTPSVPPPPPTLPTPPNNASQPVVVTAPPTDGSADDMTLPDSSESLNPSPVSRVSSIWRENDAISFANGTLDGVTVTSAPDIRVAPAIKQLAATSSSYVWCQAFDSSGNLYLGTGDDGYVYKCPAGSAKPVLFARTSQLEVTALVSNPDTGDLYAATAPHGIVYKISQNGKVSKLVAVADPYIPAMLLAGDHKSLYLATAGGVGRVYAVDLLGGMAGDSPRVVFASSDVHLLCLAQGPDGSLYCGGNPSGVVYKIDPQSSADKAQVVYDSPGPTISAVAVDAHNRLYAGSAPSGSIVELDLNQRTEYSAPQIAKSLVAHTPDFVSGLCTDSAGNVWATAGDTLYRISPGSAAGSQGASTEPASYDPDDDLAGDTVAAFPSDPEVTYTDVVAAPGGGVCAGTASIGSVYGFEGSSTGATLTGTYTSAIHDSRLKSRWGTIDWTASVPAGSSLAVETRSGDVPVPDATWSEWSAPYSNGVGSQIVSPPARFVQYRAIETASEESVSTQSPELSRVDIYFMPENRPPTVHVLAPEGGDALSGNVTLRWFGADPDRDTLEFRLYSSSDDGVTWSQIDTGSLRQRPVPELSPTAVQAASSSTQTMVNAMIQHVVSSSQGSAPQNGAIGAQPAPAAPDAGQPSLRGQSFVWNTKPLHDGTYRLKVVASDAPSNAVGALSAEAMSDPFTIVNTPPVIELDPNHPADPATGAVSVTGFAVSTLVFVKAVQYKLDDGGWMAAAPVSGIFDTTNEQFQFTTGPLSSGSHHIEVEAFDAAGNTATKTIDID